MNTKQSILIVDDKPRNLYVLERTLAGLDVEVVQAQNGNDALAATLAHDFAMAILDVQMPGMDGFELATLMRGDERTRRIPIIFMTATYDAEEKIFKGYETGAVDFIIKPYNPTIILAKVRVFLELDALNRELRNRHVHEEALVALRTKELRESQAQFKSAFDSAAMGMVLASLEGHFIRVNEACCGMMGYTRTEMEGLIFQDITHPDDLSGDLVNIRRLLDGEIDSYRVEKRYCHKAGHLVWGLLSVSLLRDEHNQPMHFIAQIQDISDRKATEDKLIISNARNTAILKAIPDLMFCIDIKGVFLDYQAQEESELYVAPEKIIGRNVRDILPPHIAKQVFDSIDILLETGLIQVFEYNLTLPGGVNYYKARVVLSGSEEIIFIIRNTTEEKLAEIKIRESEERYRRITENLSDYHYRVRVENGKVVETIHDPTCQIVTGYSVEEFRTDPGLWLRMVPEAERGLTIDKYRAILEGHDVQSIEHRLVRKDGQVRWMLDTIIPKLDINGNLVAYQGVIKDISESKKAEIILESQRNLGIKLSATTSLNEGLHFCLDAAREVSSMDSGGIYLVEESDRSLILSAHCGLPPDLITSVSRFEADSPHARLVARGNPVHTLYSLLDTELKVAAAPENLWALSILPILQEDRLIGCLNMASHSADEIPDTEQKALEAIASQMGNVIGRLKAEESLLQLNLNLERKVMERTAEAEAANRAKSAFLANMSHEIRTPMNAILGFAQLMQRDKTLTETQVRNVDTIIRSGDHLLALITDILEYSKIEAGKLAIEVANFDFREMLQDLAEAFRLRVESKGLRLLVELSPPGLCLVAGDESKIRQIVQNLLSNAVKFTDRGGVSLRAELRVDPSGEGSGSRRLVLEVEDSGQGIAPDEMGSLFKVFEQTESGRKSRAGTGLGLAISSRFAELLGGTLKVQSQVGHGSTFRLEISVSEGDADSIAVRETAKPQRVVGLESGQQVVRVLIVDDEENNRTFLGDLLSSVGFELRMATDGCMAVAEFKAWQPNLILMDMRMPSMSGAEAIAEIRKMPGGTDVRIIAVTASSFLEDRLVATESGADDFLNKPFREETLFGKIRILMGLRYRYANEGQTAGAAPAGPSEAELRTAAAALPAEFVSSLREAALRADLEGILELAGSIDVQCPAVATEVRALTAEYNYKKLLELFNNGTEA